MHRSILFVLGLVLVLSCVAMAQTPNKAAVQGMVFSDGITGQKTAPPHNWLEVPIYAMSIETYRDDLKNGIGMGMITSNNPQGRFEMPGDNTYFPGFTPGKYALFALSFSDIPAFTIRKDLKPDKDATAKIDLNVPAMYSVMYNREPKEWGTSPYTKDGTDFYQTFVATGPHITRIGVKLGGKGGDHQILTLNYAVYEPNSGPPSTWKRISPIRSRVYGKGVDPIIHIYHVAYHSNEINLTPGKTYAVRFWRDPSSPCPNFVLVVHKDNGDGYKDGQLYQGDTPMPDLDAYAYISGGEPGTVVNHAPVGDLELKNPSGGAQRFGQTFKASGYSLAGVDTLYADGNMHPVSVPVTFQVYDKPGGNPIGPSKTCFGNPLTYQARAAVVWDKGEVKLKPGTMYYIEWSFPKGANSWVTNEDLPGEAYLDGKAMPGKDLAMSIAEYDGTK